MAQKWRKFEENGAKRHLYGEKWRKIALKWHKMASASLEDVVNANIIVQKVRRILTLNKSSQNKTRNGKKTQEIGGKISDWMYAKDPLIIFEILI